MTSLAELLDGMTREGELYEKLPDNDLRCYACGHRCLIREGRRGICKIRFNEGGILRVPWGYVGALQADPIEKKPFFHFLTGSDALTFGMLGCDFHCSFCQNHLSSQALRDPSSDIASQYIRKISPEQIVNLALQSGSKVIASSYNEPLITSEWSVSIFKLAVQEGIKCVFVSNGNATPEVLDYLSPYLTGFKVDLKTMQDKQYRKLGGVLNNVLDGIKSAHERGLWVEVVTLVVPGFNDSPEELMDTALFIRSVSTDIPWHVTAFHPDYKMRDRNYTSPNKLLTAVEIGQEAGLNYVYAGNIPGQIEEYESTFCPSCRTKLIGRTGYRIHSYRIDSSGNCPDCGTKIPGVWTDDPDNVNLHSNGIPRWVT